MPWFLGYFFFGKSYKKLLAKIGLGYILGDFFTNSSGHPDRSLHRFHFSSFLTSVNFSTCDSTYDSLLLCTLYSFLLRFFFYFSVLQVYIQGMKTFYGKFYKGKNYHFRCFVWRVNKGCQMVSWSKHTKMETIIPNDHKLYQMAIKYTKRRIVHKSPSNIPTYSIPSPSKIFPNWDFWYENKPSGSHILLRDFHVFNLARFLRKNM
jgi:hypothetical protein